MAFVKGAHRGNEADETLFRLRAARNLLHPFDRANYFHEVEFRKKYQRGR
jgi:hypothetical protein